MQEGPPTLRDIRPHQPYVEDLISFRTYGIVLDESQGCRQRHILAYLVLSVSPNSYGP